MNPIPRLFDCLLSNFVNNRGVIVVNSLTTLRELFVYDHVALGAISVLNDLSELTQLEVLHIEHAPSFESTFGLHFPKPRDHHLPDISRLNRLRDLDLTALSPNLYPIQFIISTFTNLQTLTVTDTQLGVDLYNPSDYHQIIKKQILDPYHQFPAIANLLIQPLRQRYHKV